MVVFFFISCLIKSCARSFGVILGEDLKGRIHGNVPSEETAHCFIKVSATAVNNRDLLFNSGF